MINTFVCVKHIVDSSLELGEQKTAADIMTRGNAQFLVEIFCTLTCEAEREG